MAEKGYTLKTKIGPLMQKFENKWAKRFFV
jgi:hypothetical protein